MYSQSGVAKTRCEFINVITNVHNEQIALSEVPHSHSDKHRADFYRDTVEDSYDIINTILKGSAPQNSKDMFKTRSLASWSFSLTLFHLELLARRGWV